VGGSPTALRITALPKAQFIAAECYCGFEVQPDTLMVVSFWPYKVVETKIQLNLPNGNVHYFQRAPVVQEKWNVMTFRVVSDGNRRVDLGERVNALAFVGHPGGDDAYVILDELVVVGHPHYLPAKSSGGTDP
jgi:hypothetical protein